MKKRPLEHDLGHGCFLLSLIMALIFIGLQLLPVSTATNQVMGMVIGIPLALGILCLTLLGAFFSFRLWPNWPLALLSVAVIVFLVLLINQVEPVWITNVFGCLLGAGILLDSVTWFLIQRKRRFPVA